MKTDETNPNNERPNAEAKRKIIEELKENEARKVHATSSLNSKLETFTDNLDPDKASMLQTLIGSNQGSSETNGMPYDKPMQGHSTGGGHSDTSAYDKPMQGHSTGGGHHDTSAYDKPMQGHSTGGGHHDISAYDKPMQGHSTGGAHYDTSAYDKPMQGHSTGSKNQ